MITRFTKTASVDYKPISGRNPTGWWRVRAVRNRPYDQCWNLQDRVHWEASAAVLGVEERSRKTAVLVWSRQCPLCACRDRTTDPGRNRVCAKGQEPTQLTAMQVDRALLCLGKASISWTEQAGDHQTKEMNNLWKKISSKIESGKNLFDWFQEKLRKCSENGLFLSDFLCKYSTINVLSNTI